MPFLHMYNRGIGMYQRFRVFAVPSSPIYRGSTVLYVICYLFVCFRFSIMLYSRVRITNTSGTGLFSVAESCPLFGDCDLFISNHLKLIILNTGLHVSRIMSRVSHNSYYTVITRVDEVIGVKYRERSAFVRIDLVGGYLIGCY